MNNYTNNDEEYIAESIRGEIDPNELLEAAKHHRVQIKKCKAVVYFLQDHEKYLNDFIAIYKFKKAGVHK